MSDQENSPPQDENHVIAERRAKLKILREQGIAYPNNFQRSDLAGDLHKKYKDNEHDWFDQNTVNVTVAGRMMLKRLMGKASFATIRDMSGNIQLYLNDGDLGEEQHQTFKHYDIGDILGVEGVLFKTKKG